MDANERLKQEQHEKLRALIQPLGDALAGQPADVEDDAEAAIWELADDLYAALSDFFDEI